MPSHVSQSLWLWWEGSTVPCITDHLMNQHTENKKNILISYILQTLQYTYQIITNQCCQDPIPLGPWLLSLSNFFSLKSNFRSVSCLVRHWRISFPLMVNMTYKRSEEKQIKFEKQQQPRIFAKICAPPSRCCWIWRATSNGVVQATSYSLGCKGMQLHGVFCGERSFPSFFVEIPTVK